MNTATIITVKSGQVPPLDFMKLVLEKNKTMAGFAIQDAENGKNILTSDAFATVPSLEEVMELLEGSKEQNRMLFFGNLDGEAKTQDLQPFVLKFGEDDILAYCVEGDFNQFSNSKTELTETANFNHELLMPSLAKILKYSDGDVEKLYGELTDDLTAKQLINSMGHRGVITFMPVSGNMSAIGKNELGNEFDWGTTSQTHGFGDADQTPVSTGKVGWWKKTKEAVVGEKVETKPVEAKKEEVKTPITAVHNKPPVHEEPKLNVDMPAPLNDKGHWQEVPDTITGKARRKYIEKMTNKQPTKGWAEKGFKIWVQGPVKQTLQDLPKPQEQTTATSTSVPKSGSDIKEQRQNTTATVKNVKAEEATMFTMSATEKSAVETHILKHLDHNSAQIPNPLELQKIEAKYNKFTTQVGVKLQDLFKWTAKDIELLFKDHPKAAFLAFIEMRQQAIQSVKFDEKPADVATPGTAERKVVSSGKFNPFKKSA